MCCGPCQMNPEADEKKLEKQGVVQGGVCSRILVNVHAMHVGAELGAHLEILMMHIDGSPTLYLYLYLYLYSTAKTYECWCIIVVHIWQY